MRAFSLNVRSVVFTIQVHEFWLVDHFFDVASGGNRVDNSTPKKCSTSSQKFSQMPFDKVHFSAMATTVILSPPLIGAIVMFGGHIA